MKKETYINLLLVGIIITILGVFCQVLKETPNERVERINRVADRECGEYQEVMARNCYASYYEQLEDRD